MCCHFLTDVQNCEHNFRIFGQACLYKSNKYETLKKHQACYKVSSVGAACCVKQGKVSFESIFCGSFALTC